MPDKLSPEQKIRNKEFAKAQKIAEQEEAAAQIRKTPRKKNIMAEIKQEEITTAVTEQQQNNNTTSEVKIDPLATQQQNIETATTTVTQTSGTEVKLAFGGPNANYRPFRGNTVKRSYSSEPINYNIQQPIRKATFDTPKMDQSKVDMMNKTLGGNINTIEPSAKQADTTQSSSLVQPTQTQILPPNPGVTVLPSAEQERAAGMLVDILLGAYEKLHALGRHVLKVSEEDTAVMEMKGEISLKMQVPIGTEPNGELKTTTLSAFLGDYNKKIDKEFIVSETFRTKIREPLIRSFAKKGWGVTDDQYVFYLIGEDVTHKTFQVIGLKRQMNKFMDLCKAMYAKDNPSAAKQNDNTTQITNTAEKIVQTPAASEKTATADTAITSTTAE